MSASGGPERAHHPPRSPARACAAALALALAAPAALAATPVTVTILRFVQVQDPDPVQVVDAIDTPDVIGHGDYYARVRIGSGSFQRNRSSFVESTDFQPFWTFTDFAGDSGTIPVVIQMWDADEFENNDDVIDLNPQDDVQELVLTLDLETCTWTGDVSEANGAFSQGDGDHEHFGAAEGGEAGKILFDVACSASGDIDRDGIPDGVERFGVRDRDGNRLVDLRALGADPCRKTVAVEIDAMIGQGPDPEALDIVRASFDQAPVDPIDTCPYPEFLPIRSGVDFAVLVSNDDIPLQDEVALGEVPGFERDFSHPDLDPYFHYSLWVPKLNLPLGGQCCADDGDFIVASGDIRDKPRIQAVRLMHELGHGLGLAHGGLEDADRDAEGNRVTRNCKPNYLSIMNYSFITGLANLVNGDVLVDYSRGFLGVLDESALDEAEGIGDGFLETCWADPAGKDRCDRGDHVLNWNWNFDDDDRPVIEERVAVDVNARSIRFCGLDGDGDPAPSTPGDLLSGFNDWANLVFRGPLAPTAGGVLQVFEELTIEEEEAIEERVQASLRCFPPAAGDWRIRTDCTIWRDVAAPGDLIVAGEAVLRVAPGVVLDVDFAGHALRIAPGARVEVEPGGRIE